MISCNECAYLSLTEEEQLLDKYGKHRCTEYYLQVRHKNRKGIIYPCKICSGAKFKQR